MMKSNSKGNNFSRSRAQAMVEFAIVLPILMALLVGILEVGRMVFIYAAVTNASREASRYASAVGREDTYGYEKYRYCQGIQNAAKHSAFLISLSRIQILYDKGSTVLTCDATIGEDADISVDSGDRVIVTVEADYKPMLKLLPLPSRKFSSTSARTILGIFELGSNPVSGGGGGGGSASGTLTAIANTQTAIAGTPANTSTATSIAATNTPTATAGAFSTFTPLPSSTPTGTATKTPTASFTPTASSTPTQTFTPTMTFTPTATPTSVTGCGSVTHGSITTASNKKTMTMTITNPNNYSITVSNVQVTWNAATGASGNNTLTLQSISLGSATWTVIDSTGNVTSTPSTTVTIPANTTSTITFTFDKNYANPSNNSITINLSTPGCESYPIHNP
jgi:Flp pilus assembly protein TadG